MSEIRKGAVELGLCCIVNELRSFKDSKGKKKEVFCGRTINNKIHFTVEKAKEKALQNCKDLSLLIKYCTEKNIKCFRLGSDFFPRYDDASIEGAKTLYAEGITFASSFLKEAGNLAKEKGIRLLMHPPQLVNIGSPRDEALKISRSILEHHCDILDAMDITPENGVLIVHLGGSYGAKKETMERWIKNFNNNDIISLRVRKRLVIENCERQYSVEDCLYVHSKCNIPVVFDCHHHDCYVQLHPGELKMEPKQFLPLVLQTWGENRIPVMHVSSQKEGAKLGAHADFIRELPEYMLKFFSTIVNGKTVHLEVEAKAKEAAIYSLRQKYNFL